VAIGAAAAFIGLAYMASRLFELQVLEAWVRVELQELATSVVIAVFCITLIASVNTSAQFLAGENSGVDMVGAAQTFLRDSVYHDGRELYTRLGDAYFNTARVASYAHTFGMSVAIASFSVSEAPASGLSTLVTQIGQAMDSTANFMMLSAAQISFLKFFSTASTVMLPVGIFLRAFSFTRKIGGLVLAAVIASAVIYPASFMVSREIYDKYSAKMMDKVGKINLPPAGNPPAASIICNPYMQAFVASPLPVVGGELGWSIIICVPLCAATAIVGAFAACYYGCANVIQIVYYILNATFPILMYVGVLAPFANGISSPMQYYAPLRDFALPATAEYSVLSLVVFLIPLIITMTLLRNLAMAFGGEPHLYGISKLI